MITGSTLLAFGAIAFLLIILPGPSVLFIIGRALQHGRREALVSVVGNSAGVFIHVLLVAVGVGALLAASAVAFVVLKVVGGLYLIYLGVQQIRHRNEGLVVTADADPALPARTRKLFGEAFVVGVANPKTLVFMVAVLPQFVDPSAGMITAQILELGVVFIAMSLVIDGTYALIAASARAWFAKSPRRIATVRSAGGGMISVLGVALLAARRAA